MGLVQTFNLFFIIVIFRNSSATSWENESQLKTEINPQKSIELLLGNAIKCYNCRSLFEKLCEYPFDERKTIEKMDCPGECIKVEYIDKNEGQYILRFRKQIINRIKSR